jgi:hypothetical protein
MGRARVGLLVAASVAALMAGCGTEPSSVPPPPVDNGPPAPTAPVGADGKALSSLCDLLTEQDFTELTGQTAQKPAPVDVSAPSAACEYGGNLKLNVQVGNSLATAASAYQASVTSGGFTSVKKGAIGGVDESNYGTNAGSGVLNLRRLKLVVSIVIPGAADGEVKLVQLAARVLSRANALGT